MVNNNLSIPIEIVYGTAERQCLIQCTVPLDTTIADALLISGIFEQYPEILPSFHTQQLPVGIFSRRKQLTDPLQAQDRIEIYRPLVLDPKEARRKKAMKK